MQQMGSVAMSTTSWLPLPLLTPHLVCRSGTSLARPSPHIARHVGGQLVDFRGCYSPESSPPGLINIFHERGTFQECHR